MTSEQGWTAAERMARFEQLSFHDRALGFSLDLSRMCFDLEQLCALEPKMRQATTAMAQLEAGAIANPDEQRMVGHFWLRAPELAPSDDISGEIRSCREAIERFVASLGSGEVTPQKAQSFTDAVIVGIGGSSLGPQLVYDALGLGEGGLRLHFVNNTDPDGIDRLVDALPSLASTLVVVISKSGGTKETRNGMLELQHAYRAQQLDFGKHAVAITGQGSKLDAIAEEQGFVARFFMWDWVGGRTSVTSAVGLLPAALQGADIAALIDGAQRMDVLTRAEVLRDNPAAMLAASWYLAGDGRGRRTMVLLPYKDRLELTSRYLQQLVMESLGKRDDLDGNTVHQGLAVYGNKGSTDQHAYVQQLLDGPDDFFVTFIEVLRDRAGTSIEVEPMITSGDFLSGFLQGTRRALSDRGKSSLTITIDRVDALRLGALIALFERAVGLYATLINVNAYHQPAVESGKRAAAEILALQKRVVGALDSEPRSAAQIAAAADSDDVESVLCVLRHLWANDRCTAITDGPPWEWRFGQQG